MTERDVIRVGVAGVRGYKGFETVKLIARHPRLRVVMISSDAMAGHRLKDLDRDLVRDGMAQAVGYNDTVSASKDYGVELMFSRRHHGKVKVNGVNVIQPNIKAVNGVIHTINRLLIPAS